MKKILCLSIILSCLLPLHGEEIRQFRWLNVSHGLSSNQTWLIESLDARTLLVGTKKDFSIYDGVMFHSLGYPADMAMRIKGHAVATIQRDIHGNLWIKNQQHLFLFSQKENRFLDAQEVLNIKDAVNAFADETGGVWTIHADGQVRIDGNAAFRLPKDVSLAGLMQDGQEVYVIDTRGHITIWDKQQGRITERQLNIGTEGANDEWTNAVSCRLRDGSHVVAIDRSQQEGVFLVRNGRFLRMDIPDRGFQKVFPDGGDGFYLVCWMNLWHYDAKERSLNKISALPTASQTFNTQFIHDATLDWQGGLWIANDRHGLFYCHPQATYVEHYPVNLGSYTIRGMTRAGSHSLALYSYVKLYEFDTERHLVATVSGIDTDEILSVEVADDGEWWIATRDGVFSRRGDQTGHLSTANVKGLPSNRCLFAIPADGDRLFCCIGSTTLGWIDLRQMTFQPIPEHEIMKSLYIDFFRHQWDRSLNQLKATSAQGTITIDLTTGEVSRDTLSQSPHQESLEYVLRQGLPGGGEFIDDGCVMTGDSLWAASTNGITLIVKGAGRTNPRSKDENRLISIQLPEGEFFPGMDNDLIDTVKHRITLGHDQQVYTLHFSDCDYINGASDSQRVPEEWTLRILPPWWATWWAYLIYVCLVAAVAYIIYKVYQRRGQLLQQLREKRNKFILQVQEVKPEEIEVSPQSKLILDRAVALVNEHLSDSDYGVEALSRDMGMSRSNLYRTLQQITNQTPLQFLRTIRLRRAEQLLRESDLSMKEIAYRCGYNDTRTFRKAFTDFYGKSPSDVSLMS